MKKYIVALPFLVLASIASAAPSGYAGKNNDPATMNEFITVQNADAVAHGVGSVVIWSDPSLMKVSTTTTANVNAVAGVVAQNPLPASGFGLIQVYGYHSAVKISVANADRDMLVTGTTAEKGIVNNSGEPTCVFATALEATTSSTTVKAFINTK